MVFIIEPLLLIIGKSRECSGSSRFPISQSEWLFTICPDTIFFLRFSFCSVMLVYLIYFLFVLFCSWFLLVLVCVFECSEM